MDLLFAVIFGLFILSNPIPLNDERIVSLNNDQKVEQTIKRYNCTNPDQEMKIARSVGNNGRYKNIGFDYELLHRENKYPNEFEYRKGLRRYDSQGFAFIYLENEHTNAFVNYLKGE